MCTSTVQMLVKVHGLEITLWYFLYRCSSYPLEAVCFPYRTQFASKPRSRHAHRHDQQTSSLISCPNINATNPTRTNVNRGRKKKEPHTMSRSSSSGKWSFLNGRERSPSAHRPHIT